MGIYELKTKTKEFYYNNEDKIKTCVKWTLGITAVVGLAVGVNYCNGLKLDNARLVQANAELIKDNTKLTELCIAKDKFFAKFISDGTRLGDSRCAQQLAYKRWS